MRHCLPVLFVVAMVSWASGVIAAETRVGVSDISPASEQTAPVDAQALEGALRNAVAAAALEAQENGGCDITPVEISDEFIKDRDVEKQLQQDGYAPKDGQFDSEVQVSDVISGVMGSDGDGGFDYAIGITGADGADRGVITGSAKRSDFSTAADEIAAEIISKLCVKRAFRIQGGGGDPINQVVCDIDNPFTLEGALFGVLMSGGESGTYEFVRSPPGPVMWIAKGTYTIDLPKGSSGNGTLKTYGKGTVTVPGVGARETEGGETFTLTPVDPC